MLPVLISSIILDTFFVIVAIFISCACVRIAFTARVEFCFFITEVAHILVPFPFVCVIVPHFTLVILHFTPFPATYDFTPIASVAANAISIALNVGYPPVLSIFDVYVPITFPSIL